MPWEAAEQADRLIAAVVFHRPLESVYHYLVPDELREMIGPGQRVRAPFGRGDRKTVGYCVGLSHTAPTRRRLKSIAELLDREPLLSVEMLELTQWIAERYLCSWGQVLDSVVPAGVRKQAGTRMITCYRAAEGLAEKIESVKLPAKQRAVVDALLSSESPLTVDELTLAADCGTSPIKSLEKKHLIVPIRRRTAVTETDTITVDPQSDLTLNDAQRLVLARILHSLRSGEHETLLLHGVTGSGKTEVYIQAIREVVAYGRQAIVLVPEISLTPQTIRRFRSRFDSVAVLHSHLSDSERHWHWQRIARGEVQVVVGARSAVFAPTPNLGLIVIDEEHETSFKQSSTPRYHARDVARERARRERIPLLLGSATPTLESLQRTRDRHDVWLSLPERVERRPLPPVVIVDTRNDPQVSRGHSIGRALNTSMQRAMADGGQVILFLNLRGYSPVLWCVRCGAGVKCPHCDITLTWHRDREQVVCHSCDYHAPPPQTCPECAQPGLQYFGTGTQRLEQEVKLKFDQQRVLRMDSDSMKKPGSHDEALERFRHGEVDILLGTQMIAKGLDFPNVTLVGVINADTILHQPDMRAAERTFQLIAQVAGRTGRGEKGGRVLVQTAAPDSPVIIKAAAHDYIGFAKQELKHRKEMRYPPFAHLARIILRGDSDELTQAEARRLASLFREAVQETFEDDDASPSVRIIGAAPAPILKLRNQYRYHILWAADTIEQIHTLWDAVRNLLDVHNDVELTIDVDPYDMR